MAEHAGTKAGSTLGILTLMAVSLTACSSRPSDGDIRAALADQLDRPSCVTDVDFGRFPVVPQNPILGEGHPSLDAMVTVGLLSKIGNRYAFTPAGRAAYRPERKGFCYSAGYEIRKTLDIAPVPGGQTGEAADKAWAITLSTVQKPIADWVRKPMIATRSFDKAALSTEPRTYHVILAHFRGEEGLRRDDPMFSLPPGFDY